MNSGRREERNWRTCSAAGKPSLRTSAAGVDRERMEFAEYAGMESVRGLLPILDDFERALKAAKCRSVGDTNS